MSFSSRLITVTLVAVVALAPRAHADDAKPHIERATELHKEGKYTEALDELRLAYRLDPQPNLLYAIAQIHVKLGKCPEAITYYEQFLATEPAAGPAAAARQAIDVCKSTPPPPEVTPEPTPPTPPPDPTPPAPTPTPPPGPTATGVTPLYKDPIGAALVGAGVVAGVVGIVLYRGARSDLDQAESATTYQDSEQLVDDSHRKRTFAAIAGGGALVLVGAGVIHMVVRDRGSDERSVAITPATGGALVTWGGRF